MTLVYHKWQSYEIISCLTEFFVTIPFPNNPENQNFEKMKKTPEDIIILHMSTINQNHMMYDSYEIWSMRDRICSHFWPFFALLLPLSPLNNPKNQNFVKMKKKHVEISFYTILYMVPEISTATDFFCHLGPKYQKNEKKKKKKQNKKTI